MKLLDTNVFVRYIVGVVVESDVRLVERAAEVFASATNGTDEFTTTDSVIVEVVYVLTSSTYQLPRREAHDRLSAILTLPGCAMPNRAILLHALGLWESFPRLDFVDAQLAATAIADESLTLVTFDTALAKAAGTQRWDLRISDDPTGEMP